MQTLKARLNHGRWLANCPQCNGAELVKPGVKFICQSVPDHHGVMYAVEFPADMNLIMRTLWARPIEYRNWEAGETVAMLEQENRLHGLPNSMDYYTTQEGGGSN